MQFDTVLVNFPLFCPKCKMEIRINVVQFKMNESKKKNAAIIIIILAVAVIEQVQ